MEFSRQEYWSGLTFPPLGDLPHSGIKPRSLALQADSLLSEPPDYRYFGASVSSVTQSCLTLCDPVTRSTPRPPCLSPTPGVHPNPCLLCQWCHPTISSSVVPFFSSLRSFPATWSFPMRQLFASGGQSIGVSASTSAFLMNTQDWFPLGWTGWISLQSKGLSKVFSNTTVQNHEFFGAQLSL